MPIDSGDPFEVNSLGTIGFSGLGRQPPEASQLAHPTNYPKEVWMYGIKVKQQDVGWTPLDFSGVAMKVLFKDEATGAMAVITQMEAGAVIPAHFHSKADETVFVLEGQFVEDGESYGPGSYFVGKAGSPHGPHGTPSGCSVLTHFSCEPDFQFV